ncbi:MAG: aspartate--tRNA ligase, partial [Desulfatitalea sp.]|nr:aspartate--tRNA ligase [Desulfatitalea sp.]
MVDALGNVRRTHHNNSLTVADAGREVVLTGWVLRRRDHGGVIFVDLRDREGITQVVFNPDRNPEVHQKAHDLRSEYVVGVRGTVSVRPEGMENPNLDTGGIEVMVNELWIFNTATTPPFMIEDTVEVSEPLRLQNRYLDLRRPRMVRNLTVRHKTSQYVRNFLNEHAFLEIETPFLTKSTPEGARDYLVPSRVTP